MESLSHIIKKEEVKRINKILECNELLVAALDSSAPNIQKMKFITVVFSFGLTKTKKFLDEWEVRNGRIVYEIYTAVMN